MSDRLAWKSTGDESLTLFLRKEIAEQSIDEEMGAMILMEADDGKRIADLQQQVAELTQQLHQLTENQAPQVRKMLLSVNEQLAKIRKVQNWLRRGGSKGSPTKISGKSRESN
ncbi:hypothetical protein Y032_0278g1174 [Ancylostoma ceylanicum]|uniref:Uncharacterized protein n=1 Tax=Ancylostoma ceylanicum TaxID=53326 RepID=A0A016S840_9BILA|nr:hypothetical protein Y032_0278g1174 [Ancylostoma ceylanicum]